MCVVCGCYHINVFAFVYFHFSSLSSFYFLLPLQNVFCHRRNDRSLFVHMQIHIIPISCTFLSTILSYPTTITSSSFSPIPPLLSHSLTLSLSHSLTLSLTHTTHTFSFPSVRLQHLQQWCVWQCDLPSLHPWCHRPRLGGRSNWEAWLHDHDRLHPRHHLRSRLRLESLGFPSFSSFFLLLFLFLLSSTFLIFYTAHPHYTFFTFVLSPT